MITRRDRAQLRAPRRTPAGMLLVDAYAARVGVQDYADGAGGTRRELRLPEEVFAEKAMAGYLGATMTNDHPAAAVTPVTWKDKAVGTVLSARRDGDHVLVTMVISDAEAIADVEAGKRELSAGYGLTVEDAPGTHADFGAYDAIQRGIEINHLALVDAGRCGASCALRADAGAADCGCAGASRVPHSSGDGGDASKKRAKEKIQMDLTQALAALAAAQQKNGELTANLASATQMASAEKARADKAETDAKTAKDAQAAAEGQRDAEKARADKAEKARTDAAAAGPEAVRSRVALERVAAPILGETVDLTKMSDRQVKVAVVLKVDALDCSDEKKYVDAYVDARYDAAAPRAGKATAALDAARTAAVVAGGGDVTFDSAAAERAASEKNRVDACDAWTKLPAGQPVEEAN